MLVLSKSLFAGIPYHGWSVVEGTDEISRNNAAHCILLLTGNRITADPHSVIIWLTRWIFVSIDQSKHALIFGNEKDPVQPFKGSVATIKAIHGFFVAMDFSSALEERTTADNPSCSVDSVDLNSHLIFGIKTRHLITDSPYEAY